MIYKKLYKSAILLMLILIAWCISGQFVKAQQTPGNQGNHLKLRYTASASKRLLDISPIYGVKPWYSELAIKEKNHAKTHIEGNRYKNYPYLPPSVVLYMPYVPSIGIPKHVHFHRVPQIFTTVVARNTLIRTAINIGFFVILKFHSIIEQQLIYMSAQSGNYCPMHGNILSAPKQFLQDIVSNDYSGKLLPIMHYQSKQTIKNHLYPLIY